MYIKKKRLESLPYPSLKNIQHDRLELCFGDFGGRARSIEPVHLCYFDQEHQCPWSPWYKTCTQSQIPFGNLKKNSMQHQSIQSTKWNISYTNSHYLCYSVWHWIEMPRLNHLYNSVPIQLWRLIAYSLLHYSSSTNH